MTVAASINPDYLPQLIDEIIKAGAPPAAISDYQNYWRTLPAARRGPPCPICFGKGVDAPLVTLARGAVQDHLQCAGCKRVFELTDPGQLHGSLHRAEKMTGTRG